MDSELLENKEYRYSDLPYYIIKDIIENHYGLALDELIQQRFYKSIGANYSTYHPLNKFSKAQIIPTEEDTYFRFKTVHGYVHDMGAAMQNGIGGHAGLFSNANDVAKLMQMYLQHGFYGGKQYLSSQTVDAFNTCYYCAQDNRRGLGFDKPSLNMEAPYPSKSVSNESFGHTGFTGTFIWVDPIDKSFVIFLSNRVYPSRKQRGLYELDIRDKLLELTLEN